MTARPEFDPAAADGDPTPDAELMRRAILAIDGTEEFTIAHLERHLDIPFSLALEVLHELDRLGLTLPTSTPLRRFTFQRHIGPKAKPDIPQRSPWDPWPMGVPMALLFGAIAIISLILGHLAHNWGLVANAALHGAIAIFFTADAAFHAGMRAEAHGVPRHTHG